MVEAATGSVVFDRAVEYYDQTRGFPAGVEQRVAEHFVQAGHLTADSQLVEIGIGTGRIALPLATHVKSITGVDLSRPMMNRLRSKQANQPIHLIEGDISRLPLASNQFDAAIAVHIFHLVPTWQAALTELGRVLKPGAPLLLGNNGNTPAQDAIWATLREATPNNKLNDVGARITGDSDFVQTAGWQFVAEHKLAFEFEERLQNVIDGTRNRIWSRLWGFTQEEAARSADAVQAAIEATYGDPQQVVRFETSFDIRVYLPPQA